MPPDTREFSTFPVNVPDLSTWTIARVRTALYEHEQGQFANSALLFEALERSPRTHAALNTRVNALLGLPFALEAGDGDGRRDAPAVTRIKPYWRTRIAPNKSVGKIVRSALGMGVAFAEKVWRVVDGDWVPTLKPWHASFFSWDGFANSYQCQTREGLIDIRPEDPHWAIFAWDDAYDRPWQRGVVRCLGLEDAIRNLAVRDWARWSELHGLPTIKAKVPTGAKSETKRAFATSVANRGQAATILLETDSDPGKSFDVEALEFADQGFEGFQRLVAQCDGDAEIALLGHPLTNTTGVYDPKANSVGVRQDYLEADAEAASSFLHDQVSVPWARYNLGEQATRSAPRPCYDATPPQDDKLVADTVKSLGDGLTALNSELRKIGKQVSAENFVARFDIPLENDTAKTEPAPIVATLGAGAAPALSWGPAVPLSGLGASGLAQGQVYSDAVADAARDLGQRALEPHVSAVLAAVGASTGYEDLRARLAALAGSLAPARFRQILAAALAMAEAAGAWSVEVER